MALHGEMPRQVCSLTPPLQFLLAANATDWETGVCENRTVLPSSQDRSSLETAHLTRHTKTTSKSLLEKSNPLDYILFGDMFLFSTRKTNKDDFPQKHSSLLQLPVVLKAPNSPSCSSSLHKGGDVIPLALATWPACRHCLHTDTSVLPVLYWPPATMHS